VGNGAVEQCYLAGSAEYDLPAPCEGGGGVEEEEGQTSRFEGLVLLLGQYFFHVLEHFTAVLSVLQLDEGGPGGPALLDDQTLIMEAGLAIAAGADTVPTALTNALFELHTHPETIACLRKEVDATAALGSHDETAGEYLFNQTELAKMPYLNAVLQETLRLHPAVPNGARHVSPFAGILVAGRYVCCVRRWKRR
jgi:hypothetical protein